MDSYLEYRYQPRVKTLVLTVGFFGACTAILAHMAMTNDRGLILDAIIEMNAAHATIFYWVLACLSGGFVVLGLLGAAELLLSPEKPFLRLTPQEVIIPPYLFRREALTIPFSDIVDMSEIVVQKQHFLTLRYGDSKKIQIKYDWLPDDAAYQQVKLFIAQRVKQNAPG